MVEHGADDSSAEARRMIAAQMPTHDVGEVQIPERGWLTGRDALAWHEAGHAVVYTALGRRVEMVTIDPERARRAEPGRPPSVANGTCKTSVSRDTDPIEIVRQTATGSVAGVVGAGLVRVGFGLPHPSPQEHFGDVDQAAFAQALAQIPEAGPDYASVCLERAEVLLREHREAYGVIVQALLTHGTLDAEAFAASVAGTALAVLSS